jgi:hypothetical protein
VSASKVLLPIGESMTLVTDSSFTERADALESLTINVGVKSLQIRKRYIDICRKLLTGVALPRCEKAVSKEVLVGGTGTAY